MAGETNRRDYSEEVSATVVVARASTNRLATASICQVRACLALRKSLTVLTVSSVGGSKQMARIVSGLRMFSGGMFRLVDSSDITAFAATILAFASGNF